MNLLLEFFDTEGFMPHGMCLLWRPSVFWLHVVSDSLIALSYYSIPIALTYFVMRRRDLAFSRMFLMFGAFILACGTTHVMGVWTLWNPDYGVDGVIKAVTAAASLATAVVLWQMMPQALALPSTVQLEQMNQELQREIGERHAAEAAARRLNEELERRVAERTAALTEANAALRAEIAERERTAEALRRTHEILETIVQNSPLAIVAVDADRRVIAWSRSAERIFGHTAQELLGRPYPLVPADAQEQFEDLSRRAAAGELLQDVDIRCVRKDGEQIEARLAAAALYDDQGSPRGAVYSLHDVTESNATQRQLERAQRIEAVGQLTGGLAHDFNNLLTVVIGNLDLLAGKLDALPEARTLADSALEASLRGAALTRQLLAYSRRQSLAPTRLDVNALVAATTDLLRRTLGEQIEIEMNLARDLWPALADATQVESALANLAINARDAMPRGGRLTIETANKHVDAVYAAKNIEVSPGDYVMLAVSDTGAGMAPEVLERAFEPFFTTKEPGKGTGLGLSMVYGFAKQSRGHVKIYSEIGHGTTVRLYLPRAGAVAAGPAERGSTEAENPQGDARILMVEDDDDVRRIVAAQLASLGYRVVEAANAPSALQILEQDGSFDLLFSDVVMPGGMSGIELAAEARKRRPELKVLLTSGYAETALRNGARLGRPAELLSKPYRLKELARKLHKILGGAAE